MYIKREDAIKAIEDLPSAYNGWSDAYDKAYIIGTLEDIPSADNKGEWIPCSERLPEDLEIVNITWVNHRPKGKYYAVIKDKPFTATAIHHNDKWWWYSPICEDLLAEYGESKCDQMDDDIEVIAWMPLPEPWKGADDE